MEILADRYITILRFIEVNDCKYDFEALCAYFSREDLIYLNKDYIVSSYNVMTLQPKGRNYLAELNQVKSDKYATKQENEKTRYIAAQENKKTRLIALWALIISVVLGLAQLLISLLRNN